MTAATGAVWSHYVLRHMIRLHTHVSTSTNGHIVRRLLAERNCALAQIRCGAVLRDEGEENNVVSAKTRFEPPHQIQLSLSLLSDAK